MLALRLAHSARHYTCVSVALAGPSRAAWTESNKQLDPRGVDYSIFEDPTGEYEHAESKLLRPPPRKMPPSTAMLQGLISERKYADASNALAQLQRLHTPLEPALAEYVLAAHWAAANKRVQDAIAWLELLPHARQLCESMAHGSDRDRDVSAADHDAQGESEQYRRLDEKVTQTVRWLAKACADDAVIRAGAILGQKGYASGASVAVLYACRACPDRAWDAWRAAEAAIATDERRTRTFNQAFSTLARHGHLSAARQWARFSAENVPGAYPLLTRSLRVFLERNAGIPKGPVEASNIPTRKAERSALDNALAACLTTDDVIGARQVLANGIMPDWRGGQPITRRVGTLPNVELLAKFLALASRSKETSGHFLKPVREALRAHRVSAFRSQGRSEAALLYASALMRSRELVGDSAGVLRVWKRRFQDSPGIVDDGDEGQRTGGTELAAPQRPNAYVASIAMRAVVNLCRDAAHVAQTYRRFVGTIVKGDPAASPGCFEPFIRAMSIADPRGYASGPLWSMLEDMDRVAAIPRDTTWRIIVQALARDGQQSSWHVLCSLLQAMSGNRPLSTADKRIPAAFPTVPLSPETLVGVLQVLAPETLNVPRGLWWTRSRQIAKMAQDQHMDHPALQKALERIQ
ncbi:hypothetical protein MCUN1_003054 [Malassezia cuniculi]|uniref:Uncharacterized protein n=1 Tax=Malassezia cuniculi TaxID=948313 RepID=A0AAF0J726_9BASI|nr:hypothetical protein MCUN1_003054 [Malassezia cuniculi]